MIKSWWVVLNVHPFYLGLRSSINSYFSREPHKQEKKKCLAPHILWCSVICYRIYPCWYSFVWYRSSTLLVLPTSCVGVQTHMGHTQRAICMVKSGSNIFLVRSYSACLCKTGMPPRALGIIFFSWQMWRELPVILNQFSIYTLCIQFHYFFLSGAKRSGSNCSGFSKYLSRLCMAIGETCYDKKN